MGLTDFLMEMYKRNNSRIQNLIKNIDLHILHSMNPDGFEKAEQVCKSKIGRSNANGVSKIQKLYIIYSFFFHNFSFFYILERFES